MTTCRLMWLLLLLLTVMVRNTCLSQMTNETRWDVLEAVSNSIHLDDELILKDTEYYAYYFWNLYHSSSRSQRLESLSEMSQKLKDMAYRDCRHDMIGLILFGPEKSRSILRARPDFEKLEVGENYYQCLQTTAELYMKHCGPISEAGLKHTNAMSNICIYVEDMATIEDAIIVTCGLNNVVPPSIDAGNPTTDVIPTPIRGSSGYCGRVSINGISRLKLHSYAKAYEVVFEPITFDEWYDKVQVCSHRDACRGLCQCEKDDWRYIQKGSRESFVSPYEQRFVDVKFDSGLYGYVTVTLRKGLRERWRCGILVGGVVLLFMAGSKDILNQNDDDDRALKWVFRVVAVIAILLSSFDTLLAALALAFFLALNFVIIPNIATIFSKIKLLLWMKSTGSSTSPELEKFRDTRYRDWMIMNHERTMVADY